MLNRHTSAAVLRRRCAAAEESKLQPYWCGKRGLMGKTCPLAFYPFCSQPGPSTRAGMQCKGLQRHFSCCNVSAQSMRAVIHDSQKCIKDTLTPCAIWAAVGASVCCMHLWLLGLLAHHPMRQEPQRRVCSAILEACTQSTTAGIEGQEACCRAHGWRVRITSLLRVAALLHISGQLVPIQAVVPPKAASWPIDCLIA